MDIPQKPCYQHVVENIYSPVPPHILANAESDSVAKNLNLRSRPAHSVKVQRVLSHIEEARQLSADILNLGIATSAETHIQNVEGDWLDKW